MRIGNKPFIIAEMSGNHGGSLERAIEIIKAAKQCGCDAVKIQTYEPGDMFDPANNALYEQCKIPRNWYGHLFAAANEVGISLFSSIFALWAIDFLKQFDCPAYKLASPESTRLPELEYTRLGRAVWEAGKPLMASTGQRDFQMMNALCPDVLLYCKSGYPAQITDDDFEFFLRLPLMRTHRGFSDHTADIQASLAMIAAGATVIEKHFKLDDNCVDAAFSLNPSQMELLCRIAHR